jgi:hypothetical protein
MAGSAPRNRRRSRSWRQRKGITVRRSARQARRRARMRLARRRVRAMPWWQKWPLEFHALFAGLSPEYKHFEVRVVGRALVCNGTVEVDDVGTRLVTAIFPGRPSRVRPIVMADGPERSRHRFHRYRVSDLCLYFSRDPASLRWTLKQRMTGLLDITRLHLLKEAWWRVTNDWPSAEVHRHPDERRCSTGKRDGGGARGRSRHLRHERRACWCGRPRYTRCHGALDMARERGDLGLLFAQ